MTLFYYGTTVPVAITIAEQGAIFSPVMKQRHYLNELRIAQPALFQKKFGNRPLEETADKIVRETIAPEQEAYINQVTLVNTIQLALIQPGKTEDAKLVLGFNVHQPPARFARIPVQLDLQYIVSMHLTEEAIQDQHELKEAYAPYFANSQPCIMRIEREQ